MIIIEESIKLDIKQGKLTKKLPVFYNPVMKLNRDVSILLLNSIENIEMQMALPLSGSGIRGIRFLKELKKNKIKNISFNDIKTIKNIEDNLKLNELNDDERIKLFNDDANLFLLNSKGFDYIDIDPFGTPNPFLDNSMVRLSRGGILGVTATDTAALAGSSSIACMRKYYAKPLRNEFMHETAVRILIRKIQLIGAQNDKALIPIFTFSKDHYYRIFFKCEKGKKRVDKILENHKYVLYDKKTSKRSISEFNYKKGYEYTGPLWVGELWDEKLVKLMYKNVDKNNSKLYKLIFTIKNESKIKTVGYYDLHNLSRIKKLKNVPKFDTILSKEIVRTHFSNVSVRSKNIPF
jgi:tRNA (guanine26-N2/guanine27-N2)-dimethyltransferase